MSNYKIGKNEDGVVLYDANQEYEPWVAAGNWKEEHFIKKLDDDTYVLFRLSADEEVIKLVYRPIEGIENLPRRTEEIKEIIKSFWRENYDYLRGETEVVREGNGRVSVLLLSRCTQKAICRVWAIFRFTRKTTLPRDKTKEGSRFFARGTLFLLLTFPFYWI